MNLFVAEIASPFLICGTRTYVLKTQTFSISSGDTISAFGFITMVGYIVFKLYYPSIL